jgi:hypothetical protein
LSSRTLPGHGRSKQLSRLWLLPRPRTLGSVTYDVHTLLYAASAVLIGFQAISFAAFAKLFAVSEGLLPEPPYLQPLFRIVTLEVGLALGGACILVGLLGSLYAVGLWGQQAFGPLDTHRMLRLVIPSVTLLVLGSQVVLASLFMSMLWLRRRRADLG